jgi:lipoprotein-releasing system permease protein
MNEKALRIGTIALLYSLWVVLAPVLCCALVAALAAASDTDSPLGVPIALAIPAGLVAIGVLTIVLASLLLDRTRRVAMSVKGRARLFFSATQSIVGAICLVGFGVVLGIALGDPSYLALGGPLGAAGLGSALDSTFSAVENVAYAQGTYMLLVVFLAGIFLSWPSTLGIAISSWFLVDRRVRRVLWILVDVPLTAAFVWALWALPFRPEGDDADATLPSIALALATLWGARAFARSLPYALDVIERTGFQPLVAARMLRARKSGFLTAIGFLSILAVSFSSCTLTTTLSVMGGFREDLQRKILGNNAHVVVDQEYGTFEGWSPMVDRVRAVRGVVGASPYVTGEVMVTSASNLGGAILHGIDPRTIGQVTDLPRNMRHGRLEYLVDPERLLHLSAAEMSGSLLDDRPFGALDDDGIELEPARAADAGTPLPLPPRPDAPLGAEHDGFLEEIDRVLAGLPPLEGGGAPDTAHEGGHASVRVDPFGEIDGDTLIDDLRPLQRPRTVLPGLVVGQELARSLRLHVGDEVNVVSPLGELGPAGPIPRSRPFRIAGIFYSGMYEYDMQVAYAELETAQRFLSTGGAVTGISVKVEDWEHADRYVPAIRSAAGREGLRVRSWQEVNRNLFGALELEKLAMFITLGIAILVASFCIVGTLVLMVQEKGREVGILKAMGAEDRQIVGMFMLQGLLIGLVGAVTGLGLGWVVCFAAEHYGIIQLDPAVYYIDRLPIHTEPGEFLAVGVAAVVVCLLATIYPAILGSRLRPVDALRYA